MNLYVVCGFFSNSGGWSLLTVSFEHDLVNLYFWYDVLVDVLKKWLRFRCFRHRIDWNWAPDVADLFDFFGLIRLIQSESECGFSDIHSWLLLLWLDLRLKLLGCKLWSALVALLKLLWFKLLLWLITALLLYLCEFALLYEWFRLFVKGFVAW